MENVILTIHIIACIVMTIVIMLQKSEGGALGIGGGGGGLMTGRSAAGALVRVTMVFGGIFFLTSLGLTTLANRNVDNRGLVERTVEQNQQNEPQAPIDVLDPGASLSDALGPPVSDEAEVSSPESVPTAEETDGDVPEEPPAPDEEPVDNP